MGVLDFIKKPIRKVINAPDDSALGIARNTITGIPKAAKDLVKGEGEFGAEKPLGIARNTVVGLPKAADDIFHSLRGYTEEQHKQAKPGIKDKAIAIPKYVAEFSSAIGGLLGSSGRSPVAKFANETKLGNKLADFGAKITEFAKPKTVEEAKAMRFLDLVSLMPVGSVTKAGTAAKAIAQETKNAPKIFSILRKEIPELPDDLAKGFSSVFLKVNDEKAVEAALNKIKFKYRGAGEAADQSTSVMKFIEKPIDEVIKTPIIQPQVPIKSFLQRPIEEVIREAPLPSPTEDVSKNALKQGEGSGTAGEGSDRIVGTGTIGDQKVEIKKNGSIDLIEDGTDLPKIEQNVRKYVDENKDSLIKEYQQKFGSVFNVDKFKELIPSHSENRTLSEAFHRPSANVIGKMIKDELNRSPGEGRSVGFFGGATGAGKSTAIEGLINDGKINLENMRMIVDGTLADHNRSIDNINHALKTGNSVEINYVESTPEKIFENLITRAKDGGRTVPIETAYNTLQLSRQNMMRINGKFGSNEDVSINVIDNRGAEPEVIENGIDFLKQNVYSKEDIARFKAEAYAKLDKLYEQGEITKKQYEGFVRRKQGVQEESASKQQITGEESIEERQGEKAPALNESRKIREEESRRPTDAGSGERPVSLPSRVGPDSQGESASDGGSGRVLRGEERFSKVERLQKALERAKAGETFGPRAMSQEIGPSLTEIAEKMRKRDLTLKEIDDLQNEIAIIEEVIENSPAKALRKYVSQKTGELPEVTGKPGSEFGEHGDQIITELGFSSLSEAEDALKAYINTKKKLDSFKRRLSNLREDKRQIKKGENLMRIAISDRRARFRILKDRYDLTDSDLKEIRNDRDITAMTPEEFNDFIKRSEDKAEEISKTRIARSELESTIQEKDLKKTENLQKALKLPDIEDMSEAQLREFNDLLSGYEFGDEFLGQRKLETIDRTDLKGAKTYREARNALAKKLSKKAGREVSPSELTKITGKWNADRLMWDTALAEKNPFFKMLVEDVGATLLQGESNVIQIQKRVNELMKRAHKGGGLKGKLIPTDERIINYLESSDKASVSEGMSKDEYAAAKYMQEYFSDALDYLQKEKALNHSRFEDVYYPHMRRGMLEAMASTEGSFLKKFKEGWKAILEKQKLEKFIVDILDQKTGQVLPMDKYFKYVHKREGNGVPSKNAGKVFMEYARMLETKKALDKIVPEIMTYVDVATPRQFTKKGLVVDDKLKNFVTEYINNKKGRKSTLLFSQGSKPDIILKAVSSFISLRDLGVNLAVQLGSNAGAQGGVYTLLGPKNYAKGLWRYKATVTPKKYASESVRRAQDILEQSKAYTGVNPWSELADISKDVGNKVYSAMFVLFRDAVVRANQIHLLGSITPAEWKAGKISPERLAELKVKSGRWLPVERGESIYGSTTVGKAATKYKSWAIVMAHRALKNLKDVGVMLAKKEGKKTYESRELRELLNAGVFTSLVALTSWAVANQIGDDEEPGFLGKVKNKLVQDGMSFIASLNPQTLLSTPRIVSFVQDLGTALKELATLEEYQKSGKGYEEGDLKGLNKLQNTLTPNIVKGAAEIFQGDKSGPSLNVPKLKNLPPLPKLPKLDKKIPSLKDKKLPPLPKLPKLKKLPSIQ
jgi:hypothetical protein